LDKAVLGVSAIDPGYGISTANHAEAQLKKMIAKAAKIRIALADHSKFGKQSFAYVGPVSDINTLVTDSGTDAKYINDLREAGLEVIVAEVQPAQSPAQNNRSDSKEETDNRFR
jgi:DeoR family fructose operon transcriptional repressor